MASIYELPEKVKPADAASSLEELAAYLLCSVLVDPTTADALISEVNNTRYSSIWKQTDIQTTIQQVAAKRECLPATQEKSRRLPSLASKVGQLRGAGFERAEIESGVRNENQILCNPPLDGQTLDWLLGTAYAFDPKSEDNRPTPDAQGNAERFLNQFGKKVRYCAERQGWYIYQDQRGCWKFDDKDEVQAYAMDTIIRMEAFEILVSWIGGWEYLKKTRKSRPWYEESRSVDQIRTMLQMASFDGEVRRSLDGFDADRELLATPNGILNLRTGAITPNTPEAYLTRMTRVAYDPNAKDPLFDRFLDDVTGGDESLKEFLQRAIGYSLLGDVIEDLIFFLFGRGGTGKSTFLNSCLNTLGTGAGPNDGYGQTVPFGTFLKKTPDSEVRLALADLPGVRIAVAAEASEGNQFNVSLLKNVSGGEEVPARNHYKGYFRYRPAFSLWFTSNYQPHAPAEDSGFWRRMIVIPFDNKPDNPDKSLRYYLMTNPSALAAIFRWMVDGCRAYLQHGLTLPVCVRRSTAKYRSDEDTFAIFVIEMLELGEGMVLRSDVREAYVSWCRKYGMGKPMSMQAMNARLEQIGLTRREVHRRNVGGERDKKFNVWEGVNRVGIWHKDNGVDRVDWRSVLENEITRQEVRDSMLNDIPDGSTTGNKDPGLLC